VNTVTSVRSPFFTFVLPCNAKERSTGVAIALCVHLDTSTNQPGLKVRKSGIEETLP
jgi:hypothetical protein